MAISTGERAELLMDQMLRIHTVGRDESGADQDHNPYEPTPYPVLERLAGSGLVGKRNTLVDYGCGKGRVGFYLSYQVRCRSIGIERDEWLYAAALRNLAGAASGARVGFERADAGAYVAPVEADRFYFFNPFSAEVFAKALEGIRASLVRLPREALLLLYYPDNSYISCLAERRWLEPCGEVDCRDLFGGDDPRERIAVYRTRASGCCSA